MDVNSLLATVFSGLSTLVVEDVVDGGLASTTRNEEETVALDRVPPHEHPSASREDRVDDQARFAASHIGI
nr:hypothetical protein OG409_37185 [Streptomyces sp. NBC_00974]